MKRVVVDASVSLKWIFDDEEDANFALTILNEAVEGRVQLISPTVWLYEVANGIRSAILRRRIDLSKGQKLLSVVLKVAPEFFDFPPLVIKAFKNANKHEISVYDASYLALAAAEKAEFYTGDESLYKKVKPLKFVKLISQY